MRNLKKVFAVILTVALLASLMVPALAAVSNEAEALKLQKIGLFAGNPEDLKLDEGVTRIQGLAFAIRAAGKEAEAFAMTEEEVAAELAKFVDADQIPGWGKKYAAYAIKHGITVGVGNGKFAALDPISGTSFLVFLLKSGMGYSDVTTANVIDVAVEAKVLTAGQAIVYGSKAALIRDDAAAILYGAAKNGVNANGKSFIQSLIDAGFVDQETAWENGFGVKPAPKALEVVEVKADNLVEVVVKFNQAIDADSIEDGDFTVDGTSIDKEDVSVSKDKTTVTISLVDYDALINGEEYELDIEDVKAANGSEIEYETITFEAIDNEIPEVLGIEFTGPDAAKLTFSEPIASVEDAVIVVDNGIYSAEVSENFTPGSKTVEINLGTELDEGKHTFKISGFADYAEFTNGVKTLTVEYVDVDTAPEVSIKEATQTYVVLEFNRPVKGIETSTFYQTYSSWQPLQVQNEKGNGLISADDYVSVVRLVFVASETWDEEEEEKPDPSFTANDNRPLPVGNVKIVVCAESDNEELEDRWGNKLDGNVTLTANVTADTTAPTVTKVTVEAENEIRVYFSEAVVVGDATKKANYTIKDSKGNVIKDWNFPTGAYNEDENYVTIEFKKDLAEGEYTITVEAIADRSLSANPLETVTKSFKITDVSEVDDIKVTWVDSENVLYVKYGEAMATSGSGSVLNKDNYRIKLGSAAAIKLPDSAKLTMFTDSIVKIQLPNDYEEDKEVDLDDGSNQLIIGRVADKAGNTLTALSTPVDIDSEEAPEVTSIKKIDVNKFEIEVNSELKSIKSGAIKVDNDTTTGDSYKAVSFKYTNKDGKAIITVTVPSDMKDDSTVAPGPNYKFRVEAGKIISITGMAMAQGELNVPIDDGMAPKVLKDGKGDLKIYAYDLLGSDDEAQTGKIDTIKIFYSEAIKANSLSKYTYTVDGYKVQSVTLEEDAEGVESIVVIRIEELDEDEDDDLDATPSVTQRYAIEDAFGNELAPQDPVDAVAAEDVEDPARD